ncbi:hypothetical protein RhiirA1_413713 [Rhizophagus irregularis]|uniref:Uncharacterized protein n=1 Tax=Rhizophagus irregularis TaxID=588596 RepID=A0A2N0S5W6_9GLOM|nr:hypothetical protein RhiirA1_413713 [Rhizophagus irregularis]
MKQKKDENARNSYLSKTQMVNSLLFMKQKGEQTENKVSTAKEYENFDLSNCDEDCDLNHINYRSLSFIVLFRFFVLLCHRLLFLSLSMIFIDV